MASFRIEINAKWCKSCGICAAFCPKQVYAADADGKIIVQQAQACIGCRMCEYRCPDMAVTVIKED